MKTSKKIFLVLAILFFVIMIYIGYDISSRTTFPGSKPQLQERLLNKENSSDSIKADTVNQLIFK